MAGINTGKVITGGLVAGVVFNVADFLWNLILEADYAANMARLGLDTAAMESPLVIGLWVVLDFLMGILVVFTYAAIRPRFGPGPKTASIAGLIPYLAVTMMMLGMAHMGILDLGPFFKASALQLVGILAGSIAGGYMYKEA